MTITLTPAKAQVLDLRADALPSLRFSQIKPKVALELPRRLKANGFGAYSPVFSAVVSRKLLGEKSPDFQALVEQQGADFHHWTTFAPGCSPDAMERWKRGKTASPMVHQAACQAVEALTGSPFPWEAVSAVEPDFEAEYRANWDLVRQIEQKTAAGEVSILGLGSPRWKESGHALGVPLYLDAQQLSLSQGKAIGTIQTFQIQARYRGVDIPVGCVVAVGSRHSLLFDARPYLWRGADLMVGRKLIRLVCFKGEVESRLLERDACPKAQGFGGQGR